MYGHTGYRWSISIPRVFDQMPLANGQTFAGYKILRRLGSGGMGDVYLAQHPRLPRQDALKVLAASVSADAEYRARFGREADLASTLWHPNIVGVHDRGEDDGQLWISMDYVEGQDAARLLARQSSSGLRPYQVTKIVSAVADALDYAHERGLLHRDVKPANIMITADEQRILLADFGIARNRNDISGLTATNFTVGTMAYAAPEQLMGEDLDSRADQYALAATTYHLLTGSHLFPHSNPAVVIGRHLNAAPPALADARPELAALDSVLAIALAKDPSNRFRDCKEFARALSLTRVKPAAEQNQHGFTTTRAAAGKKLAPSTRPAASVKEPASSPEPATHTKKATGSTRPPTDAAPAPRSQAPQQTRPAISKHWPLVVAVLALTIAVIGVVALLNSAVHGATSRPSRAPTTSAVPGDPWTRGPDWPTIGPKLPPADATAQLLGLVPNGDHCHPSNVSVNGSVAAVSCNPGLSQIDQLDYYLYPDQATLNSSFDANLTLPAACPGRAQSPQPWSHGRFACANYPPRVMWSIDSQLMRGIAIGHYPNDNIDQLYQWWAAQYQ